MKIFEKRETSFVEGIYGKVSLVLILAVLLWATGTPLFLNHAKASALSSVSDTLTNSNNGSFSGHTIQYTNATSTLGSLSQTIQVILDPDTLGFTQIGNVATSSYINLLDNGVEIPIVASCTAGQQVLLVENGNKGNLTFTLCAATTILGGHTIKIEMGTSTQIFINPAATQSYRVTIGGTQINSGETRVAILPNVTLTASINTSFTFTVTGLATSTAINGVTTSASSTATALPFSTLVAGASTTLGQQLNVTTNARNGFVVTVQENQPPTSGAGAIINLFSNGATTSAPTAWVAPTGTLNSYNTYSHFGLTSNDSDENGGEFTSAAFVGNFDQPRAVFSNNGPSDGTTQNVGLARVAYRIQITALQAAGQDYTNTLTYVATPTF